MCLTEFGKLLEGDVQLGDFEPGAVIDFAGLGKVEDGLKFADGCCGALAVYTVYCKGGDVAVGAADGI